MIKMEILKRLKQALFFGLSMWLVLFFTAVLIGIEWLIIALGLAFLFSALAICIGALIICLYFILIEE